MAQARARSRPSQPRAYSACPGASGTTASAVSTPRRWDGRRPATTWPAAGGGDGGSSAAGLPGGRAAGRPWRPGGSVGGGRRRPRSRAATRRCGGLDLPAALSHGPRGRDESRPHAGDRGRSRRRGRAQANVAGERPADAILGEENGAAGTGSRRWILDPIDGHPELRARHPGVGDAGRTRVGRCGPGRSRSAPALRSRWWAERGQGRSRTERRCMSPTVGRVEEAVLSFSIENAVPPLARRAWHVRGLGDFWAHMLVAEGAVDGAVDALGLERRGISPPCR